MNMKRLLGAAAVAALLGGAAYGQTPTAPAEVPKPVVVVAPTPPVAPPASSIVTPPAAAATTTTTTTTVTPATPAVSQVVAKGDIVDTLKADGHFKTFIKALDVANMTGVLKSNKNLTVFAPTDAAFAALPAGELDRLMKNPAELQKLLTYHVLNATLDGAKIKGSRGGVKTVAGADLVVDGSGATLMANNAVIVQADVLATNGTVHVVDKVLMPSTAPSLAAVTGGATDAAVTAPAAATIPAGAAPPTAEPAAPPKEAADPAKPKGLACQAPPASNVEPAQKRSVQDMADETRSTREDDLTAPAAPAASYSSDASATMPIVTTRVVTNGPVPDTAENRARYGQPLSRAGKRTAPAGN